MGCTSSVSVPERKIVLLGKTGDGKSSAGNTILGENVFTTKASASDAGVECQKAERKVHGRKITVIDTPGQFDTDCEDELKKLVDKCGGRCHVIDHECWNKRKRGNKSNRVQVKNLLKTIDEMVKENGSYTNEVLQKLEEEIQEEMENITDDTLLAEEKREKSKTSILYKFLKKCVGVATGTVLGALLGMAIAVALVMSVLQLFVTLKTAITAAGVGAVGGGAAAVGAGTLATGVLVVGGVIGGVVGAVRGIVTAWNTADEADSVCDVITKVAVNTWDNGLSMAKKAEEMCGLNSKMANLH